MRRIRGQTLCRRPADVVQLRAADLKHDLKRKLLPAYCVHGDEPLLVEEACDLILAAARQAGYSERTVLHADARFRWSSLEQEGSALSLFATQRILDVRVAGAKFDKEATATLKGYAANPPPDTLLLLRLPKMDRRKQQSAWARALDQLGALVPVYEVRANELPRWLAGRLKDAGLKLQDDALRYLADRVEGNLLAARQDIDKLRLQGLDSPIELDALMRCVEDSSSFGVFEVMDAMLGGDRRRLARALASLEAEGTTVFPILGLLRAQLVRLSDPKPGYSPRKDLDAQFQKRQGRGAASRALAQLALIDAQGKGQYLGDAWVSLERLLLNLAGDGQQPLSDMESDRQALSHL